MSKLTRDGTADPVSRDQIIMHERRQGKKHFPCQADHEHVWHPFPVDPYLLEVMTIPSFHTADPIVVVATIIGDPD